MNERKCIADAVARRLMSVDKRKFDLLKCRVLFLAVTRRRDGGDDDAAERARW